MRVSADEDDFTSDEEDGKLNETETDSDDEQSVGLSDHFETESEGSSAELWLWPK